MAIKFKNDRHFEERIVQALIVDHSWAEQMIEVLDVSYFNLEHLNKVADILFSYYKKYTSFPSFSLLISMTKDIENDLLKNEIAAYFIKIKKDPLNGDLDFVKETSLDFCRKRSLAIALENTLGLIEKQKYEQILPVVQKAIMAGSDRDIGHVFDEHFEKRMAIVKRNPIPTPWDEINSIMQGGLSGGELGVVMAPSGVGKSHCLVDLGVAAATLGYNVAHYSFELGDIYIGKRYDANISGIPFDNLVDNIEEVRGKIENLKGKVVIKSYPVKSVTTIGIKNHINRLTLQDKRPDVIIIDYGDLLKSTKNYDQKRLEEEAAYEDLRALAQELDLPVWTATQTNREGLDADVLTLKHVAECFGKAMISDFFLTMTRKKENTFKTVGNFYIAKSRLGADGIKFPILMATALSKIEVLSPDALEDGDSEVYSVHSRLKKKFQVYQKNGGLAKG